MLNVGMGIHELNITIEGIHMGKDLGFEPLPIEVPAGLKEGVDPFLFKARQKLSAKRGVQRGLPAGEGHPASRGLKKGAIL